MEGIQTLKGSWPWPWPSIRHIVLQQSSTSTYIPTVIQIEETFCGRTDVRTDGRTDIFPLYTIRSTFGSRPDNANATPPSEVRQYGKLIPALRHARPHSCRWHIALITAKIDEVKEKRWLVNTLHKLLWVSFATNRQQNFLITGMLTFSSSSSTCVHFRILYHVYADAIYHLAQPICTASYIRNLGCRLQWPFALDSGSADLTKFDPS